MEYISMFFTHFFKVIEYFVVEGLPEIPLNTLPEAAEALFFNIIKIVQIYLSTT